MSVRQLYQSQYILKQCFVNKQKIIRTSLNNAQDYLNAVYDNTKDALRVNINGGVLPKVDDPSELPQSASDGQICPVYNKEKKVIDFYEWVEELGEWVFRGSTIAGNALNDEEKEAVEWVTEHIDQVKEVCDFNYIVNVEDIILDANNRVVTVQNQLQDIDDDLNGDGDDTTPYRIDISGYVLSVSTYADNDAPIPDRYHTQITYTTGSGGLGNSHIFLQQEEFEYFAALENGKNILRVYYLTNAMTSPVKRKRLTLHPDGTATDENGDNYPISDAEDRDGDAGTMYCIDIAGYALGVETYSSEDAVIPDKCYVKVEYESDGVHSGRSHIYIDSDVFDECFNYGNGRNIMDIYYLHTVFPASVTISEMQYQFPSDSVNYVMVDASGNAHNIEDLLDKDNDEATHILITVNGYALDLDGYYNNDDPIKHRIIVKMNYNMRNDTTDIYIDREHYEWASQLRNGKNVISIYSVGAGMGIDASRIANNANKVHIWRGKLDSVADLNSISEPENGDTYQIGNKEYSWNDYEWVELGDNSSFVRKESPIAHVNGTSMTAEAGNCYRWTVPSGTNATLSLGYTSDSMSSTYIDIDLGAGSTVACNGMTMKQQPTAGKVNRCRIDCDGTTPRFYVYEILD